MNTDLQTKMENLWRQGNLTEAEKVATSLLESDPDNQIVLQFLAKWSLSNKDFEAAAEYWERLSKVSKPHWEIFIGWSQAAEHAGDLEKAIQACKKGLIALGGDYLILFVLGQLSQKAGYEKQATTAFFHCYHIITKLQARKEESLNKQLEAHRPQFEFSKLHLSKSLNMAVSKAVKKLGEKVGEKIERVENTEYVRFSKKPVGENPLQQPQVVFMPDLPPIPWFDTKGLGFLPGLEQTFGQLMEEVLGTLRPELDFKPILKAGQTLGPEMEPLAGSTDWGGFYFHKNYSPNMEAKKRFPKIFKAIGELPLYRIDSRISEAKIMALKGDVKVPAHFGLNNTTLNILLPIVLPGNAGIKVGGEERAFQLGKALVFDDSFIHEIWNNASETLILLSFEVWKPGITAIEKDALEAAAIAENDWYQERIYDTLLEE